jgi:hypothetical protein
MKARSQLVSLKLPRPIANRLKAFAKRSGKPQAELIREGLELRLAREGGIPAGSVLDIVADLAGSLAGSPDLGSSPKHLRGFGR